MIALAALAGLGLVFAWLWVSYAVEDWAQHNKSSRGRH